MASKADLNAAALYSSIMEELKVRALSLNTITNAPHGLPSPLVREYCFLQLRMICELIALGCLVAHDDIPATKVKSLQKEYRANEILNRLESLHPNFYPIPRKPAFGYKSIHFDDYDDEFLTKPELISLYVKSGDVLHKGGIRRLIKPQSPIQNNYPDINKWGKKILNLLSTHTISRVGGNFHFLVFLEAEQKNGGVLVAIAKGPEDGEERGTVDII